MFNPSEKEEKEYLEEIKQRLSHQISKTEGNIHSHSDDVKELKDYLWENRAGMDHAEKLSVRQSIWQTALTGESAAAKKRRLEKLLDSPWFGRIDFTEEGSDEEIPIYIGVHSFFDPSQNTNLVHDWRAPVSSMYYDFELGKAYFDAPSGEIKGDITLKRQYRIRKGEMEFMIESSLSIQDDILQQELSRATDDKMKNIVATIQRDQNRIIRNDTSHALIIQGVAGSGKTSIALHRIAFLLYKYKETINSKDILIISPNKVFADYISNVLPELGEEKIGETGMEELAGGLLAKNYKFQDFFSQVSKIIEGRDLEFIRRISFKASHEIVGKLNQFALHVENNLFVPNDLKVGRYYVPFSFVEIKYQTFSRVPLFKRFAPIAASVSEFVRSTHKSDLSTADIKRIEADVKRMMTVSNIRDLYKEFYNWLGKPELFRYSSRTGFEYADVYPMIYLKIKLEGVKTYDRIKHLLIDEMQDYTPVQYAVLARLFPCKKTILGDSRQAVNLFGASSAGDIAKVLVNADVVSLFKSYRSTYEITRFAQGIQKNDELIAIEREGDKPGVYGFPRKGEELKEIEKMVADFINSGHNSLGIICKTQKQAEEVHGHLQNGTPRAYLLNSQSMAFVNGVVVAPAHLAKGLEFDRVIVPFVSSLNYRTDTDKRMLYIACTRAMHKLYLTCTGQPSAFIEHENQ